MLMQAKSLEHKYYISEYATYMGGEKWILPHIALCIMKNLWLFTLCYKLSVVNDFKKKFVKQFDTGLHAYLWKPVM